MKFHIPITLDRQFERTLSQLTDKYGEEMMEVEGMSQNQLDTTQFFANFMGTETIADATIDDNANVSSKNINTMMNESRKPFNKLLSRNKIFIEMKEEFGVETAKKFLEYAVNGRLYEHDSHLSSYLPYCFAFGLDKVVEKGLFFLPDMKTSKPKHWDTFNNHVIEFISYATNQLAGAVGIPDYLIYAYYFYKEDSKNMSEEEKTIFRDQRFQQFIYSLNQPYLKSSIQSAYTNISILDMVHIAKFFGETYYPDGTPIISHINGLLEFQELFLDYIGRLRQKQWHTFPVLSASLIYKDGQYQDEQTAKMVVKHNWEYGFNDVNIMNVEEATSLASCCRLTSDTSMLNKTFNSIGGSDVNIGSTKVVTINLVRLAIESEGSTEKFQELLKDSLDIIHKYHFVHRRILQKLVDKGLLPIYSQGLMSFEDQFATVGINGVYEMVKIFGGITETSSGVKYNDKGLGISEKMFDIVNEMNSTTGEEYGYVSNVEQVPAESAAIKLALKDRIYFGERKINKILGKNYNLYGNQWIPLKESSSIQHRVEASKLDNYCGGGAILHINLGENFNTLEDAWEFTKGLAESGVKYFSYISLINICGKEHSFFGKECPICGGEVVTQGIKIVGYLVKQDNYREERKQELSEREFYSV